MLRSSQWNSRSISITIAIADFSNTPGVSPEAKLPPIFSQSKIINSESINRTRYLFRTISIFQYQIINWSKEPWRQFATNYGAVCGSLEQTKTPTTHTLDKNGSLYDPAGTESWSMLIGVWCSLNNRKGPTVIPANATTVLQIGRLLCVGVLDLARLSSVRK